MNERTRMFVAFGIVAAILFSWVPLMKLVEKETGWVLLPVPTTQASTDSTTQPISATTLPAGTVIGQGGNITLPSTQPGEFSLAPSPTTQPHLVNLGSADPKDPKYALQMSISPGGGGGIEQITLNDFTERVGSTEPFSFEHPYSDSIQAMATKSVTINGVVKDLSTGIWRVDSQDDHSAMLSLDLNDGAKPVLTLRKMFVILPRTDGGSAGARGFDTTFKYEFINRSAMPLTISSSLIGPTFPASEQLRGGDRQMIAAYQGKNSVVLKHDTLEGFTGSTATKDYATYEDQPLIWFGAGGNYFNGIVRPEGARWVKDVTATALNPEAEAHLRAVAIQMDTTDFNLAPGATQTVAAKVFFGPRQRELLKNAYYAAPGVEYQHTLETTSSCSYCTFSWLVDILMSLLGIFHSVLGDWGLSIIALVFLVRACLHPITKRSQVNMAQMSKMGPEIERIKKKYGDDKDAMNRAMMQFYKSNGATPVLGCLPMFLQMPIWIALYSGLSSTFELRQQGFFYGLTWIKDLSQPDHLLKFSAPIKILIFQADGLNLIPILMGVAFFLQQKLTPKPPASTPEQAQQQKMMQWMTLLFPLMLYSSPSGLNLYIMTSTIFGIIESRIVRKHIAEREAAAKSGPVIVDAEVLDARDAADTKKGGGIMGWFTSLQERADKIRADAEKQARQKRNK